MNQAQIPIQGQPSIPAIPPNPTIGNGIPSAPTFNSHGGVPVMPPMGGDIVTPPQMPNVAPIGQTGQLNVGQQNQGSISIAMIAYVAEQMNCIKKGVIDTKEAKTRYKELYSALDKDQLKQSKQVINNDGTVGTEMVTLEEKFSMKLFRTFFPDDYKKVKDIPTYTVDMSEAKIKYYIIKFWNDKEYATSTVRITTKNPGAFTIIVSNEELKTFLAGLSKRLLHIVTNKDQSKIVGYLVPYLHDVNVKDPKTKQSTQKKKVDIRIYDVAGHKCNIRDLSYDRSSKDENVRVPYIVLKDMTAPSTFTDVNDGTTGKCNILNIEKFRKCFPSQDPMSLPARKVISKATVGDEKKVKELKKLEFKQFDSSFETLGLTPNIWDDLKRGSNSGSSSGRKSMSELMSLGAQAIEYLNSGAMDKK